MMKRKSRHLAPLSSLQSPDLKESISILDDLSDQWDEVNQRNRRVNQVLRAVSESDLLNTKTKQNLDSIIQENEKSSSEFKQKIVKKKEKVRNKRKLKIDTSISKELKIGTRFHETVDQKLKQVEKDTNELAFNLMNQSGLGKDWTFNKGLSQFQMTQIMKNIVRLEQTIIRYRNFYGRNPLLWTPSERRTISKIYLLLSKEYGILHYEEGRDRNKLIADNLINNPLNKLRRFNRPSAPRGPNNTVSVNTTFKKFVDATPRNHS